MTGGTRTRAAVVRAITPICAALHLEQDPVVQRITGGMKERYIRPRDLAVDE